MLAWLVAAGAVAAPPADFAEEVVPLLRDRCFRCHEGRDARSGIRLDIRAELLGTSGGEPLVVPGDSDSSRLVQAVRNPDPALRMPPEGPPLQPHEIALLTRWVAEGAAWDGSILPEAEPGRDHWAFQPVRRPKIPDVSADGSSRTPIDRFILAAQQLRGLTPNAVAPRRTLIRRLYLDMLGVPPSWEQVQAFEADQRPDAWEHLIERVLADPRYGERWGRHWLDIARWAESEGFESNHPRPFAWRYRDYVVDSFNADRPFDEFLTQQIAGDELPDYSDENLIATGFLAAARISSNEEDKWLQRNDVTVDIVNAVGSAFLGLTLHCAQCHDHKFDSITAHDYYALHAFFARGLPLNVALNHTQAYRRSAGRHRAEYGLAVALQTEMFEQARTRFYREVRKKLTAEELRVYDLPPQHRSAEEELAARRVSLTFQLTPGGIERRIAASDRPLYSALKRRISELEAKVPPPPQTFAFYSPVTSPHALEVLPSQGFYPLPYDPDELSQLRTYVMVRGDVHQLGEGVSAGFPHVLHSASGSPPQSRRDLAAWLTRPDHPLVSRVWVNRIWQFHFGQGLVPTANDFGTRGARPSHPELLDWLASELVTNSWSTKHIHRLILKSAVYRQAAGASQASLARDPGNRWLTRFAPRRLEAEAVRDAWLAVSGELDSAMGGASVPVDQRDAALRRSVYLFQRRGHAADLQRLFDGPQECEASLERREVSTSPLQSLYLLNSQFSVDRAAALAGSIRATTADREAQIVAAFRRVLLRDPRPRERAAAVELWQAAPHAPLATLCQALLNLNEFQYVE